jgi:hypothetical protein
MPYTAEDVRTANGLLSVGEWRKRWHSVMAEQDADQLEGDPLNQSGRTTEMLIDAAVAALNGETVLIVAATWRHADQLGHRVLALAMHTDRSATPDTLQILWEDLERYLLEGRDPSWVVFRDHYRGP